MNKLSHINKMASPYRHATLLKNINHNLFICILILLLLPFALESAETDGISREYPNDDGNERRLTREYDLRQGALRGMIVRPSRFYELQNIEMFLGIPYAAPPTGSLRFMPPVSAPPWPGVKKATRFAPVCPQRLPVIKKGNPPTLGRQHYISRLKKFLTNESEDCLYLNIYVPYREQKSKKFPVLVFIHGDSFEWSSGNPYDGRILAAYGNIMVITINYRLGILGFMKPSLTEHVYGNNGLLDQLAALKWIKDNIEDLNGDSRSVTIMGHGTGAACVNFLMMSPISSGLFHRAILMSGSALSDWAMTKDPSQYTLQVAQSLGCNPNSKDMMACLQEKPLSEIKRTQIWARDFETPLGPIVAGSFIPNEPLSIMESYPDLMSKYQLLFGVTEYESYNDFGVIELDHGILENQRDDFIRKYLKIVFGGAEDVALKEILKKYAATSLDPQRWTVEQNRELILNVFSDARTTAPILRFANYQSMANKHSYFYVFGHNSISTEYASLNNSIHGEDLPYIFGVPLGSTNTHFHTEYTQKEKLFSEVIMKMWTNFVKTGSPNSYNIHEFYTMDKHNWKTYSIDWPQYNAQYQNYLRLDIPPAIRTYYRSNFTNFWVNELPSKMKKYVVDPLFEFTPGFSSTLKPKPVIKKTEPTRKPWHPAPIQTAHYVPSPYGKMRPYSPPISRPDTEQIYREIQAIKTPARPIPTNIYEKPKTTPETKLIDTDTDKQVNTSEATIALIVSLAILFIAINIAICLIVYFKKRKGQARDNTIAVAGHSKAELGNVDMIGKKCEKDDKSAIQTLKNSCGIIKSLGFKNIRGNNQKQKTNKPEPCKTPKSDDSGGFRERFQLRRHLSTSTLDAQTKVRDWIANEVMQKCSSNNIRKSNSNLHLEKPKGNKTPQTLTSKSEEILTEKTKKDLVHVGEANKTSSLKTHQRLPKSKTSEKTTSTSALDSLSSIHSGKQSLSSIKHTGKSNDSLKSKGSGSVKSKKVSVAIDATPSARTNSILKQEPIELTKSLDCTDNPVKHSKTDQESQTKTDGEIIYEILGVDANMKSNENKIFKSVVNVSLNDDKKLKISHKHSSSDPVTEINYDKIIRNKNDAITPNVTLLPPITFRNDINVTSREETIPSQSLTPAEALLTIQRRNYPKVLPDFPKSQKRLSLQPNALQSFKNISKSFENQVDTRPKVPPQPPPRTSTLDKRLAFKNSRSNTSSFESTSTKRSTDKANFNMNYENIDEISPYRVIESKSFDSFTSSQTTEQDKTKPKIIIASSDIPGNSVPRLIIKPSASNTEIPSNAPRIRLPDDFHSQTSGSITSFSCDSDNSGDDVDEEDFEDDLIQELVGSVDLPDNPLLDSKGPATVFERKLEIIPVKIKAPDAPLLLKGDYVCISDLHLPDIGTFEHTARIKPNFGLNKLQHRTQNLNKPLEKSVKLKQKKSINPNSILNKSLKIKDKKKNKKETTSKIEHSESNSSNDTESSTGTVKRVEIKKS